MSEKPKIVAEIKREDLETLIGEVESRMLRRHHAFRRFAIAVLIQTLGTILGGATLALAAALVGILDFVGRLAAGLSLIGVIAAGSLLLFFIWRADKQIIEEDLPKLLDFYDEHVVEGRRMVLVDDDDAPNA